MYDGMVFSVTALNTYVQKSLRSDPLLRTIRLRGEIGSFKAHYSGHWYFTLKDESCAISAVMWRQNNLHMSLRPQNGMRVVVVGSVELYPATGSYQINVTAMRPEGVGDLYQQFEMLKAKLAAEGLFDQARKRPLPMRPRRIAAVTAETGAVIHDICNVARHRDPGIPIVLVPSAVQGEGAADSIAAALAKAAKLPQVDVIIVGRGGGSMEDLWCFNSETVARAIADCPVPVISAVGHETDFTIADFVADVRASTPSNAAEIAVPSREETTGAMKYMATRLEQGMQRMLDQLELRIMQLTNRLEHSGPEEAMARRENQTALLQDRLTHAMEQYSAGQQEKLLPLSIRLEQAMEGFLRSREQRLQQLSVRLEASNPRVILERGYAWVTGPEGHVATAAMAQKQQEMTLLFADGTVQVVHDRKEK